MSSPVIKNSRRIVSSGGGGGGGSVTSVNSGTDITVDNTDPANPIINYTGTADDIVVVANYSALPAVGTVTGQFYWCSASQGTKWLPGSLGGTYYSAGMYYSNGVTWEFLDVPYNATQAEVNTGTNADKFVTPATLSAATTVIPSTGTTGDIISFSAANTPSRIAAVATGYLLGSQGTSTLPAWLQAATLNTSLTTPLLIGGTGATDDLIFRTTSGAGTTGADFIWQSGNNGATELMRLFNAGKLNVGSTAVAVIDIDVNKSVNGFIGLGAANASAGNAADATVYLRNNNSQQVQFSIKGSGYATSGLFGAGIASYYTNATGLYFFVDADQSTVFTNNGYAASNEVIRWNKSGVGISGSSSTKITAPSALLHLAAGTATAGTAPLKFTSGTNTTVAVAGQMEYDGTNLFFTRTGTTRGTLIQSDAVNTVSPTSPDRTITVNIGGTTYYIAAKTTND